jgi:hypothetical protein
MIYGDHEDWQMKFWNFTDQNYLTLRYLNIETGPESSVVFEAATKQIASNSVHVFKLMLMPIDKWCNMSDMDREKLRIKVINKSNDQPMHIYFVGSSKPTKSVNWCIDYDDKNYRKFKRWFQWKKLYIVCRFETTLKHIKKFFNN